MWEQHLHHMYQQWMQGNDDYLFRYMDFVGLVASQHCVSADVVMQELQKCKWFKRPVQDYY